MPSILKPRNSGCVTVPVSVELYCGLNVLKVLVESCWRLFHARFRLVPYHGSACETPTFAVPTSFCTRTPPIS